MSDRWDQHFLALALECARMSKDPSTKVGAVLVGWDNIIIGTGFNGFPRRIADTPERLNDRETKLELVVHAEMNAVLHAARRGQRILQSAIYVAAFDQFGTEVWGGPPCVRCTVELMQAGVTEFVSRPKRIAPSRWHESIAKAQALIEEAGLHYREVPLP